MRPRREVEVIGLAFLDVISCGLGGVIVLMLIFSSMADVGGDESRSIHAADQAVSQGIAVPPFAVLEIDVQPPTAGAGLVIEPLDRGTFRLRRAQAHDGGGVRYLAISQGVATLRASFRIVPTSNDEPYRVKVRLISARWRRRIERSQFQGEAQLFVELPGGAQPPRLRLEGS